MKKRRNPTTFIPMMLVVQTFSVMIAFGQVEDTIAIAPPIVDKYQRTDWDASVRLKRHNVVVFLYQNAALVYYEDEFINTTNTSISVELSLPSTGYTVQNSSGALLISKGLLGLRLWVDDERKSSSVATYGNDLWYSIRPTFFPGRVTRVRSMFWVPTIIGSLVADPSLDSSTIPSGKRLFVVSYGQAADWDDTIEEVNIKVVLKDGLLAAAAMLTASPEDYSSNDSTWTWTRLNIEPTIGDDVQFRYDTVMMEKTNLDSVSELSAFFMKAGMDQLLEFARGRKRN